MSILNKRNIVLLICLLSFSGVSFAQGNPLEQLNFLIGDWMGTGSGYGDTKSKVEVSFYYIMQGKFIEMDAESRFAPKGKNNKGQFHQEKGFFSYDEDRKLIIYRQFSNDGYVNQYYLNDTISTAHTLVFDTERTENFVPDGKARWIIQKEGDQHLSTSFNVAFPKQDFVNFGSQELIKNP
ncbi:heme-binding beta-barrel domain-containing protein [Prolixibacter denitrificans]|uniref:THAP4-like heme-binding domain-containing protein n=1 Tax=Prolixibacter denitrificans TaxID=1541063 RepID=A0A2P8CDZ3_9BACT|nr:heme-binding beta-barrel domain-containing protein [Prolixibacter denitrificans]PSK83119.1 hypothetical protein CLV93_10449 [Prolixibacter denitrificans]GET21998.1 hypothetical protein JCM18694_22440 [Prolixibacter denitrificans]